MNTLSGTLKSSVNEFIRLHSVGEKSRMFTAAQITDILNFLLEQFAIAAKEGNRADQTYLMRLREKFRKMAVYTPGRPGQHANGHFPGEAPRYLPNR